MTTDRLDEEYMQERYAVEASELDRWWGQQTTRQPTATPSTPSPISQRFAPQRAGLETGAVREVPGSILETITGLLSDPIADRVIRYLGGTPANIPAEIEADLREAGVDESLLPTLVPLIEGGISQIHAMGPGKPLDFRGKRMETPVEAAAAEEALTGETLADVASRVNMARIQAQERTKTVLETINKLNVESGATKEAVRGVVTHEATTAGAVGKVRVEDLLARQPGEMIAGVPLNEQITAARRLRVTSAQHLADLAQRVTRGDAEAADLLYDALAVHGKIDEAVTGMSAEVGRALEAHKIAATSERGVFDPQALGTLADRLRGITVVDEATGQIPVQVSPERLAQMIIMAQREGGQRAVTTMARDAVKHPRLNALMEAWINGLLSGPQTHAANFLSNTLTGFWAMPERALAARLHPFVETGVMKGEATQMLYGLTSGVTDALVLTAKSLRQGESMTGLTKIDIPPSITAEALHVSGVPGRAVDLLGSLIRTPGKALMAADEFFKAINYRMELHAQAFRQAATEGLSGEAMGRRVAQIVSDPPASIHDLAADFAAYQTFTKELGETGQAFLGFANSHPAIRLIVPFIRTPTNIFKYAIERTPVLNLLAESTRAAIKQGGPARDLALARMSLGGMVMATVGTLAGSGMITGDGPHHPALRQRLRETGWQPYSIRVGDTYYSYNRLDPIGMLMGLAANIFELGGELPSADLDQLAMAAVMSTMEALTSKTYLQGLANVLEAIKQPDEGGVNFLRGMARSLVPAGVAQVERSLIDPQIREANGLLDEIRSRIPGWSSTLPPRRNLFGEPIMLEGGLGPDLISPIYTTTAKDDPVAQEIVRLRLGLTMPSKYMGGARVPSSPFAEERATHGVELTPQEYDQLVRLAGNELKGPSGRGMHEELAALIASPRYQQHSDGPDGGKAFMIRKVVQVYRDLAQATLRAETPELDEILQAIQAERLQERLPDLRIAR